ncbi:polysaccharide biosynthesis C-terminal domain-containing protein [Desulfallas sp. Bu1-1]|uniref:polysaccharide biosynthesis C-terminal domain-containing protein n=1 Tax=Desulfallas sp. Bu1-1 TaxID=2787620 RepID=UPI00189F7599|nr:polysaccharide biosynthesis C-terminal domain-containing protein [Desulfallas sp. Bu1-1]MBF7081590.1 polysaccharide biosynthesis C-terminal domain-containing protein [Desulfallas sp. Bu1-1]
MFKTSILNLLLRGLTLGSKLLILLFIARYLSPKDLGIYGLMTATISISLYFLGMDFYIYNTREILAHGESKRALLVRDQIVFHSIMYLFFLPLLLLVFVIGFLPWQYFFWFYIILILEHISQEATRLLTTLSQPIMANTVLFFRSGVWVYAIVLIIYHKRHLQNLTTIWLGWLVGASFSIILSVYALRYLNWEKVFSIPINWVWIRKGLVGSLPFLCATISLQIMQYGGRYFIQLYHGEALVGVFTFYFSIANVVEVFVFTGVVMILLPKIITSYQQNKMVEYHALMKKMSLGSICGVILLSVIAALGINPLLLLIKKTIYANYIITYWMLLISVIIKTLGQIPHYILYIRKMDIAILKSTVVALVVSIIMNFLLIPSYGSLGASLSILIATLVLSTLKFAAVGKKRIYDIL